MSSSSCYKVFFPCYSTKDPHEVWKVKFIKIHYCHLIYEENGVLFPSHDINTSHGPGFHNTDLPCIPELGCFWQWCVVISMSSFPSCSSKIINPQSPPPPPQTLKPRATLYDITLGQCPHVFRSRWSKILPLPESIFILDVFAEIMPPFLLILKM